MAREPVGTVMPSRRGATRREGSRHAGQRVVRFANAQGETMQSAEVGFAVQYAVTHA
jgi:hypothetical protein